MNVLATVSLALSLSADAFAVAVGKGVGVRHPRLAEAVRTGLIFGGVEASMPLLGWGLGTLASGVIARFDHWVAFLILAALGIKMIAESFTRDEAAEKPVRHEWHALALAALGSSIDSLGVGVTLAFIKANICLTAAAIGTATFLMSTIGFMVGHAIGARVGKYAEGFGGVVLIVIGTRILWEHLAP